MMNTDDKIKNLIKYKKRMDLASQQADVHRQQFQIFAQRGDKAACDELRDKIHDETDNILDNAYLAFQIAESLSEL